MFDESFNERNRSKLNHWMIYDVEFVVIKFMFMTRKSFIY